MQPPIQEIAEKPCGKRIWTLRVIADVAFLPCVQGLVIHVRLQSVILHAAEWSQTVAA
jgi:hypothetical protein